MNIDLFDAILAMDSYNRGYGFGLNLGGDTNSDVSGTGIGDAIILTSKGDQPAQQDGFYAIAYQYASGATTIAYRGTDSNTVQLGNNGIGSDIFNGYGPAVGGAAGTIATTEAMDALNFYQAVYKSGATNISVTGHSLGGGLAGLVGAVMGTPDNVYDDVFESMNYSMAAVNLVVDRTLEVQLGEAQYNAQYYNNSSLNTTVNTGVAVAPTTLYASTTMLDQIFGAVAGASAPSAPEF
jgi:hypothetical protein